MNTIKEALRIGRKALASTSETASLDAQVLLADLFSRPRAWVLSHTETHLDNQLADEYQARIELCASGTPLPYVLGWWEFYGRRFEVSPAVLIPRPETELMVDRALKFIAESAGSPKVVDVGTGSGCIAVTLALEASSISMVALDRSSEALAVARRNCVRHGVEQRVLLVRGDLLNSLEQTFDLICANLPYIPRGDLAHLAVAQFEPILALDGGRDGLEEISRLVSQLGRWLAKDGLALIEIGAGQGTEAEAILARNARMQTDVELDFSGKDRLLVVRRRA